MRPRVLLCAFFLLSGCRAPSPAEEAAGASPMPPAPEVEVAGEKESSDDTAESAAEVDPSLEAQQAALEAGIMGLLRACEDPEDCQGFGTGSGIGSGGGLGGGDGPGVVLRQPSGLGGEAASLPPEVVQRVVRGRLSEAQRCYETALVRSPDLAGKLTVHFVIGTEGRVSSAAVESSDLGEAGMERCILEVFRAMSFPKPRGSVVSVRYPLTFAPTDPSTSE
jgi:TonB family protein